MVGVFRRSYKPIPERILVRATSIMTTFASRRDIFAGPVEGGKQTLPNCRENNSTMFGDLIDMQQVDCEALELEFVGAPYL